MGACGWVCRVENDESTHRFTTTPTHTQNTHTHTSPKQVNFWRSLDEALKRVEAQLASPGVRLTLRVLKQARRIIAVAALEGGNTGVDHANKVRARID